MDSLKIKKTLSKKDYLNFPYLDSLLELCYNEPEVNIIGLSLNEAFLSILEDDLKGLNFETLKSEFKLLFNSYLILNEKIKILNNELEKADLYFLILHLRDNNKISNSCFNTIIKELKL
jgi:hypothetical protein